MKSRYFKLLVIKLLLLLIGCTCIPQTTGGDTHLKMLREETAFYLEEDHLINDLKILPQDAKAYLNPNCATQKLILPQEQQKLDQNFNQKFFAPWHQRESHAPKRIIQWSFGVYSNNLGYGENQQPHSIQWINELLKSADLSSYPNTQRPAITLRNTSLRVLPTDKPHFNDSNIAGEGYPFDNLQNSILWANTPIFVSHLSTDQSWAFTESSIAHGWINIRDIAFVDDRFIEKWQNHSTIALVEDGVSVIDEIGLFRFKGNIGAIFPKIGENGKNYRILIAIGNENHQALMKQANVSKEVAVEKPLPMSPTTMTPVINQLLMKPYGWGGLYENRDCSSLLKDLFTPFGLWLPRNSAHQAKVGNFISLTHLNAQEKEKRILSDGIPYKTLLWKQGHILLYMGQFQGKALVFHSLWGIKTWKEGKEGRKVIGHSVITTLSPGNELSEVRNEDNLLENLIGMTLLVPPYDKCQ